jgi:hypothetical protein
MTNVMSTPARRDALLASKLFTCLCAKCSADADPHRAVPCPRCHARDGTERELSAAVAAGRGDVSYARPSSAAPGAHWLCATCDRACDAIAGPRRRYSVEQVFPGPASAGGLAGRAWERVLERNVLHFQERAEQSLLCGHGESLLPEASGLHEVISRSVGSEHWTSRRLSQILAGAREQAQLSARLGALGLRSNAR